MNAKKVDELNEVYVATDDQRIVDVCSQYDIKCIITSEKHQTGTDRVGEVSEKIDADIYVNIQGDEPMLGPSVIREAITPFFHDASICVTNLMTQIKDPIEVVNSTIPKVLTNNEGMGVYLSRQAVPYPKGSLDYKYYKQVCVYGISKNALSFFYKYGIEQGKAKLEQVEDIEVLRFIENGYKVKFIEVESNSIAVDTEKDLLKVNQIMEARMRNC